VYVYRQVIAVHRRLHCGRNVRMSTQAEASRVLIDAEVALSGLMRTALEDQQYSDVAAIASVSERLRRLIESLETGTPTVREAAPSDRPGIDDRQQRAHLSRKVGGRTKYSRPAGYPRFERDGDRLVKIGWSKKKKGEYEHRAPRHVALALAKAVRSRNDTVEPFVMEAILPVIDQYPSYQVYVALAWLRASGTIRRKGADGYVADLERLTDEQLMSLWSTLPEHE
jgi:hypothetical protein